MDILSTHPMTKDVIQTLKNKFTPPKRTIASIIPCMNAAVMFLTIGAIMNPITTDTIQIAGKCIKPAIKTSIDNVTKAVQDVVAASLACLTSTDFDG